jgi:metal-responsive CopG/Arc/MetJ family transcriptional regulator
MNRSLRNGLSKRRPTPTRVPVTIRLPEDLVKQIDRALDQRDVPLSRNNWFFEAVIEKLRKGHSGDPHGTK